MTTGRSTGHGTAPNVLTDSVAAAAVNGAWFGVAGWAPLPRRLLRTGLLALTLGPWAALVTGTAPGAAETNLRPPTAAAPTWLTHLAEARMDAVAGQVEAASSSTDPSR